MAQERRIAPLTEAQLRALTTPRLLAYQQKMMRVHETESWDDHNKAYPPHGPIRNKDDPRWGELRALVRSILNERENVYTKGLKILLGEPA